MWSFLSMLIVGLLPVVPHALCIVMIVEHLLLVLLNALVVVMIVEHPLLALLVVLAMMIVVMIVELLLLVPLVVLSTKMIGPASLLELNATVCMLESKIMCVHASGVFSMQFNALPCAVSVCDGGAMLTADSTI